MTNTLDRRYGTVRQKKPLPRWFWYAVAAGACIIGIAFVAWVQIDDSDRPTARDVGYNLISDDEASVTFELSKRPDDTAVCALKALNSARAPVGWKEVTIGPASESVSVQEVTLRTLSEATTVTVESCWKSE